ncbi:Hsp70 family protein [Dictyobacter formicarum]|uniref:Molecular chaperone DnaK n=1 Tax=Dictyobacter formicarum TaxID=2778368 RepID=A0ABQ3V8Z2_9CHLR|nr:Hsp70 family protein [Dictyobacter formicarum]GHO82254.1 hypothetical protein KSZ_02600 [Dictyobacter formicarum]
MRLGIDFGTCFSSAAFLDGESITLIKDCASLGYSVPSSVFLTPQGQILVGKAANNQRLRDPLRYRREIKRDLGNARPVLLGEQAWLPEQLVMHVLRKIKQDADAFMTNSGRPPFTGAVITIPATYQQHKRDLMLQAATEAGFVEQEITLLEEPVAAGLYYTRLNQVKNGDILLVYDLGGGTFDTALMQKAGERFQYLATPSGLSRCGGADFDRAIYQDLVNKHPELRSALQGASRPALMARATLGEQCIDLKHQLSESEVAEISFVVPGTGDFIDYRLTHTEFNQMIATAVQETMTCCQQMLQQANIKPEQINHILLVGGSCRIPYVQQTIQQEFLRPVSIASDLELAICQGVALYDTLQAAFEYEARNTINEIEIATFEAGIRDISQEARDTTEYTRTDSDENENWIDEEEEEDWGNEDVGEVIKGHAVVLKTFYSSRIAGCRVRDGAITQFSRVRIFRRGEKVYEGRIASLRQGYYEVSSVKSGDECGIGLGDYFFTFRVGDVAETFSLQRDRDNVGVPLGMKGHVTVFETYYSDTIAGCLVTEGIIMLSARIGIWRHGVMVREDRVESLQINRRSVVYVSKGDRCGLSLKNYFTFRVGDVIETLYE